MLILLSCAKTMAATSQITIPAGTLPLYAERATAMAMQMSQFPVGELERILKINAKIAVQNYQRFQQFHSPDNLPLQALLAYTGIVFKRLNPKDFLLDDFNYAQKHLRLTSFCYGLLRPLDLIKNYRMEGDIVLPELGGISMFDYWKPILTDAFIADVKKQGGVLVNLASGEMKQLFDWKRVEAEVNIITPEFQVDKGDRMKTIVIYTKMCRGEMARYILKNRLENPEDLKTFSYDGFTFRPELSDKRNYLFTISD